jgi:hypothetical protein
MARCQATLYNKMYNWCSMFFVDLAVMASANCVFCDLRGASFQSNEILLLCNDCIASCGHVFKKRNTLRDDARDHVKMYCHHTDGGLAEITGP